MKSSLSLPRIEYLPTVLIPALIGIYTSTNGLLSQIPSLIGWSFLALGQNLLNDFFDKDRKLEVGKRSLMFLTVVFTLFALPLFKLNFLIIYPLLFLVLNIVYNWKLKKIGLLDIIVLAIAYSALPYLFYADNFDWVFFSALVIGGFGIELIHEWFDQDATYKLLKNKALHLARISIGLAIIFLFYKILILKDAFFFLPMILIFIFIEIFLFLSIRPKNLRLLGIYTFWSAIFYAVAFFIIMNKL